MGERVRSLSGLCWEAAVGDFAPGARTLSRVKEGVRGVERMIRSSGKGEWVRMESMSKEKEIYTYVVKDCTSRVLLANVHYGRIKELV